mgnify:CR=1 FL=1|jgi:hypothetical protein
MKVKLRNGNSSLPQTMQKIINLQFKGQISSVNIIASIIKTLKLDI